MKKFFIIIIFTFVFRTILYADTIPDLKKNANVLVENYKVELTIINLEKAVMKINIDKLILNENGNEHGLFIEYYDKFRKITSFEGEIYDAENKIIEKIKYRDLIDRSLINDFSLYEDNRIKYYEPQQKKISI